MSQLISCELRASWEFPRLLLPCFCSVDKSKMFQFKPFPLGRKIAYFFLWSVDGPLLVVRVAFILTVVFIPIIDIILIVVQQSCPHLFLFLIKLLVYYVMLKAGDVCCAVKNNIRGTLHYNVPACHLLLLLFSWHSNFFN